ncbi:MAG: 30S ribosomal protein S9 [Deltaproteobacteria bacterium]|jgi:small subunit ribosomal protein S9|nr:30S ribosomal protein S9 [Deltaproteobacteria bacterium]
MPEKVYYATGKRKTSIARVWMKPGDGKVTVNDQEMNQYFKLDTAKMIIFQPLELTGTLGQFDIDITVLGGGMKGQAGAIRHGITRGLLAVKDEFRESLKKAGLITRDPRKKERKKYGQKGARKRFQYSKR